MKDGLVGRLKRKLAPFALIGALGSPAALPAARTAIVVGGGVVVASVLSGCAVSYRDGKDKVDFFVIAFPGIGGAEVKHTLYRDYGSSNIEGAFDSSVAGNIFGGGAFEMKIFEEGRKFLWQYRIETAGTRDGKPEFKLKVWDAERTPSDWMYSVPDFLPCSVKAEASGSSLSDLTGSTYYYNLKKEQVEPRYLVTEDARKFVRESVQKK